MLCKSRAIVLHQIKFGGSSLIVTLYTEKYGRIACIVNGVRSKKTRIHSNMFQPLSLLELDLYYRQNRDIQRIKEVTCAFIYTTIPFQVYKNTIALFLAEVLYLTLREEESNPALFSFLFHAFQLLDGKKKGIVNFHLWFMLHYSGFLGIFPADYNKKNEIELLADLQVFYTMPSEASSALTKMLKSPQEIPENMNISNQNRTLLLDRIIRYYNLHLEGFSKLKSYTVLQEVFK